MPNKRKTEHPNCFFVFDYDAFFKANGGTNVLPKCFFKKTNK